MSKVSISAARAANVDKGKTETEEQRVKRLVGLAVKASHESFNTIADGAAAAVWFAIQHGRCVYMNMLFSEMHPKDSLAFRAYYVNNVMDAYGIGGQRDPEDETKWKVRPVPFFKFTAKPMKDGKNTGEFFTVNKSDKPEIAQAIKDGLKNARSKTEGEFREIAWVTPQQAATDNVLTPAKALSGLISAFKRIAKDLPHSGMGRVELLRMVNSSPLDAKSRKEIDDLATASEAAGKSIPKEEIKDETDTAVGQTGGNKPATESENRVSA